MSRDNPAILEARDLGLQITVRDGVGAKRTLTLLDDVNLTVNAGDIVGFIGESGSGKTTLARVFALMYRPTAGEIRLDGEPARHDDHAYVKLHRDHVQLMFQDPFASLNSMHRVRYALGRALQLAGFKGKRAELEAEVIALLTKVRLLPVQQYMDKFPHQLSGGQRQRLVLARALASRPEVLLADEPISMLDVSIRAEILNLLEQLRDEENLAIVYVTHDVASARYICDNIAVIYAGQIVEFGTSEQVIQTPQHPYTRLLIRATPDPEAAMHRARSERFDSTARGEPPNLAKLPVGCRFVARCPAAIGRCHSERPADIAIGAGHRVRCLRVAEPGFPETLARLEKGPPADDQMETAA